jgi:Cu(I)/Ag(I) efflux system membrane protein CusA/SilA
MSRIAAPMVGGMVTAPLLSMLVIPAAFLLLRRRELRRAAMKPRMTTDGLSNRGTADEHG